METLEKKTTIYQTTDYDQFKLLGENRKIDKNHVNSLIASIKQFNELHLDAIIVTSNMEVVDGQHRLMAAKKLEVPIYYQIDDDYHPQKMILFNTTQRNWGLPEYLNFWCSQGKDDYLKLRDFIDKTKFPLGVLLRWISRDSGLDSKKFRTGRFNFSVTEQDLRGINNAIRLFDFMKERNYKPEKIYKQIAFHRALRELFLNKIFDEERFFDNLENIPHTFQYVGSYYGYLEQLISIYNYREKNRMQIISDGSKFNLFENERVQ